MTRAAGLPGLGLCVPVIVSRVMALAGKNLLSGTGGGDGGTSARRGLPQAAAGRRGTP
jgi:hypothetical protein